MRSPFRGSLPIITEIAEGSADFVSSIDRPLLEENPSSDNSGFVGCSFLGEVVQAGIALSGTAELYFVSRPLR